MRQRGRRSRLGALAAVVLAGVLGVGCSEADSDYRQPVPPAVDAGSDAGSDAASGFEPPRAANNRDYATMARAAIDAATQRLHVIEYVIYPDGAISPLLDAMLAAQSRGVQVMVLADEAASQTAQALALLEAGGVTVRQDSPNTTTHNKLIIADDLTLVGSHNFSHNAMEYNNEASVLTSDPQVAAYYDEYFTQLWANSELDPTISKPDDSSVTPIKNREIAGYLDQCLREAKSRIRVVLYAMCYRHDYPDSDSNHLVERLVEAQQAGIDVAVILDQSDWIVQNEINDAAIEQLSAAQIPLRYPPANEITHAKMLICDDTVVVSDANWCYGPFSLYNGTSALVHSVSLAMDYQSWFDAIWQRSSE